MNTKFWDKVSVSTPEKCWEWKGATDQNGYGCFGFEGRTQKAHRVSFFLANGYLPPVVAHTCDNPPCVNTAHLFPTDKKGNEQDKVSKGRHHNQKKTSCPKGHEYDETNTHFTKEGWRVCVKCKIERKEK